MKYFIPFLLISILISACSPSIDPIDPSPTKTPIVLSPTLTATIIPIEVPTATPTTIPQSFSKFEPLGPELDQFPNGADPLTGLMASHPEDLDTPAVLVSISNSPASAIPQAGLSFASVVNEFFLGYGTTRYLTVFYGERARRISDHGGECLTEPLDVLPDKWVGNKVWFDENKNGQQDDWEVGVPGVCLELIDEATGNLIATTGTTINGYYSFNLDGFEPDKQFSVSIKLPTQMLPSELNVGYEDLDSDLDPEILKAKFFSDDVPIDHLDIGLIPDGKLNMTILSNDVAPERTYVGPIRSGRLTYNDFTQLFPSGCLVFASAGADILPQLDPCELVFGQNGADNPNTALLDFDYLRELSHRNNDPLIPVNYSGNLFTADVPADGKPALSIHQFFHQYSQTRWEYQPLSGTYLRYTDDVDGDGLFHPDVDRLTNRQLEFENIIYLLADHSIYRRNQYDVELCCGLEGWAFLFRDGFVYKIRWSTNNREWEAKNGFHRPIKFIGSDKQPFPLKPGNTWINLYTTNSTITEQTKADWLAFYFPPDDSAFEY